MNKGIILRRKIHNVLIDIHRSSKTINHVYSKYNIETLPERDRAFVYTICLNSMRYYYHCRNILNLYTSKEPKLNERILICCAITQLIFLDFKEYAVINSTVEIAKHLKKSHGFVNAILQKIKADKIKLKKIDIEFNHFPTWFKRVSADLTNNQKKIFLKNFFNEPDLHLVFKSEDHLSLFEKDIFKTSNKSGFLIKKCKVTDIPSYKKGHWWVQDFSSSFPLNNIEETMINKSNIDLCAAPGGKSFQILSSKNNLVLNDISKYRLERLNENLKRLKLNAKIMNEDVMDLTEKNKYDFIILDAPCSAIGTIRKNPEILFRKNSPRIEELVSIQKNMLNKSAKLLKKNGIILYMVCSFLKIETVDQIKNFLDLNKNYSLFQFSVKDNNFDYQRFIKKNFMITLPDQIEHYNIDGYFAAYLKKINEIP